MRLKPAVSQVLLGIGLALSVATLAEAQASRTWVSGVGDDVNPCSRTAPCKTFAGAISKTAPGGYIDVLDPGGFGTVTITKSITIDGGTFMGSSLAAGTTGIIVNAAGINVTLRNLDIAGFSRGSSPGVTGILILAAGSVHVERCNIVDFSQAAINLSPSGSGVLLFVSDTSISNTTGIYLVNGRATIDSLRAEGNTRGVSVSANALATVRNSYFAGGGESLSTLAASSILNVENTVSTNNAWGIIANAGSTVRVSNSDMLSNTNAGLFNDGTSFIVSLGGNTVQGNPTPGAFKSTIPKQ
jgi:hypothetical protein